MLSDTNIQVLIGMAVFIMTRRNDDLFFYRESLETGWYIYVPYSLNIQRGSTQHWICNTFHIKRTTNVINTESLGALVYIVKTVNPNEHWGSFVSLTKKVFDYSLKIVDAFRKKVINIFYLISNAIQETFNSVLGNIFANFKNPANG